MLCQPTTSSQRSFGPACRNIKLLSLFRLPAALASSAPSWGDRGCAEPDSGLCRSSRLTRRRQRGSGWALAPGTSSAATPGAASPAGWSSWAASGAGHRAPGAAGAAEARYHSRQRGPPPGARGPSGAAPCAPQTPLAGGRAPGHLAAPEIDQLIADSEHVDRI